MRTLRDYANDVGQNGEGGMLDECIRRIGISDGLAVEFGAGDDLSLLNTLHLSLRGGGWRVILLEADRAKCDALSVVELTRPSVATLPVAVTVDNINDQVPRSADLVVIDVDGLDLELFKAMESRPAIVMVEHHPMIPPHVSWYGGQDLGASALALVEVANAKSYALVGATSCNLIFVEAEHYRHFVDLENRLVLIFDPTHLTFAVSNVVNGDYTMMGTWPFGRGVEKGWE